MLEADWQKRVIKFARACGWRVAHFTAAKSARGRWVTPVAADGAGFPDLVLVRDRVVFAELKRDGGRLRVEQEVWGAALEQAGAEFFVWMPRDWDEVKEVLR